MTTLVVTAVADSWVNGQTSPDRRDTNYGDTSTCLLTSSAGSEPSRRIFLKPELPNIAGRTVLDAYLVGHGKDAVAAQTITVAAAVARWQEGRIDFNNQPGIIGTGVACAVPATAANVPVEMTGLASIVQAVADGSDWFGLRLTTSATTVQRFHSSDSGQPAWEFHIELSDEPDAPTGLRPDGGAVEATSPVLSWDALDDQALSRVQVDTPVVGAEPDQVAPDYDSGWQTNGDPTWSLVGRRTLVGAGPHFFRVQLEDAGGNQSAWSDWAEFTVEAMPTLVVDSPTGTFGDPSPTVAAHLSFGSVKSWDVMVTGASRADVRYFSELRTSPTVSLQVPKKVAGRKVLREDEGGEIRLRVWPTGDWTTAVGALPYRQVWISADFDDDALLSPVTNFTVQRYAPGGPRNVWSWNDTEPGDAYLLQVDDVTVVRVEDLVPVEGRYAFTDGGEIPPMGSHTLSVKRVESGSTSRPAKITDWSHVVKGVWLLPENPDIEPMVFRGTAIGDFFTEDAAASYTTLTGDQVDIIYGTPGRRLTFTGEVFRDGSTDVYATLRALKALMRSTNRNARMVWGSESSYGFVRSPSTTPADSILPNNHLHNIRFGFVEVD